MRDDRSANETPTTHCMASLISTLVMVFDPVPLDWVVTSAFHSGPPLGAGFVIGVLAGGTGMKLLYQQSATRYLRSFTLADVFTFEIGDSVWNPFCVRTTPTPDALAPSTERVLRVLIANKGRMRQNDFADATGWSDATVSRLLSRMERDGDISRVNVGRTKLVFLGELRREEVSGSPLHETE